MVAGDQEILGILGKCAGGQLSQQENQCLEFKELFSWDELKKLWKDFAGFANCEGGIIIFGIRDNPRELVGMDATAVDSFNEVDLADISETLRSIFSREIACHSKIVEAYGKKVGVFHIPPSKTKPTIAVRNKGDINNGDVYYRYNGVTSTIRHAELEEIIQERIRLEREREIENRNKRNMYID